MFAVLAVIFFAIALILHVVGGHANLVTDFTLAGFIGVAAHLVYAWTPWVGRRG